MAQQIQTKRPGGLTGKRLEAFKKLMKLTATSPKSLQAAYDELSEIYKTRKSRKDCLKLFNKSPEIPLKVENQSVVNTA